uniref:Uncharacterized 91 kDa protein in cob intron n=1 Tax=Schizosaccharomyces pombe (strain 972 / ATCC 24843) TaxID=284812 RepID=YMC6_SCHPO|nr:hypothetical protein ScpofMp05 [Schizosaccharomyces pombe]P05511.4 RecName: Full=Uncharacterized 91 kDa protein in cob intron [Schizosaccharomyces pombe 972h-]CAA26587.1 unnamed protein product [Schizosaccharomyces pombe]CAA38288.1 unnamed protein product [Schizosaccharomyces pombe]|eukprot:NP_039503.1 hypothetical protein ScpofMp05 (mitochondrion) [Schizosaccharomyces pombe]
MRRCGIYVYPHRERDILCVKIWTIHLGSWGNPMPNRACVQKVLPVTKQISSDGSVQIDTVRAVLPEFQFPSHPQIGDCLSWIETFFSRSLVGFYDQGYTPGEESCTNSTIKGMSGKPTSIISNIYTTTGPAKVSNDYAVRDPGVAVDHFDQYGPLKEGRSLNSAKISTQWSGSATLKSSNRSIFNIGLGYINTFLGVSNVRGFSTGSGRSKNVLNKLDDLSKRSKNYPNLVIDRNLYKDFLLNRDMFLIAYNKLKSNPGMMTHGLKPDTLDGMSIDVIDKIIQSLKSEEFNFTPGRRILIDKASGGKRPLTIGSPRDKLVQEILRIVLEAIYEPLFNTASHGFRPGRSCHSALRSIFTNFKGCTWWIEGDIKACFDSIPHDKLIALLSSKIKDQRFIQLIRKALNAGYLTENRYKYDIVGTPQGSIVSPILANIYLHQLDEFIENLKSEFDYKGPIARKRTSESRHLHYLMAKAKRENADSKTIRKIAIEMRNVPNKIHGIQSNKLMYVRYADDWIVAVNGSYTQTKEILAKITCFCSSIGLTVSPTKTKITNSYTDKILFLGTNISHSKNVTFSRHFGILQRNSGFILLSAPMDRIAKKLRETGLMLNHKGRSVIRWLPLDVRQIIGLANSIIRGYDNYYSFVHNRGRFATYVYFIIKDCVLRTLAHKLSLGTRMKVIKKFGPDLSIYDYNSRDENNKPKLITQLFKPSWKVNVWGFKSDKVKLNIRTLYASHLSMANLENLQCAACQSTYKVEMHHVRQMKNLKPIKGTLDYLMAKANRKQIPLCRSCHMKLHANKLTLNEDKKV